MENIITLDNHKMDLCKLQSKKTYDKTKNEHPEKYKAMLARKAEIYQIKKLSRIKIL